ncbi:MAG TPA: GTP-binding protein [Burkholderiales bacterium]|nr:GTP-binding protein [Burkholderiales bacterium]
MSDRTPVNVITGFLGSGKTTLLQRMLGAPQLARTAVLINEFGEVGLDHLLVQRVEESLVLLQSGCICCSMRGDLSGALRDLLGRREREDIPPFDRVVVETTGLADPGSILNTLLHEPVVRHHYRLGNVITTVDAVNARLHLSANPEGIKQIACADRLLVTKTDLAPPELSREVQHVLAKLNPAAEILDAQEDSFDIERLLAATGSERQRRSIESDGTGQSVAFRPHMDSVSSFSLVLDEPLDWTAFGIWLSLLLNRHGNDVLRVKGILRVQGSEAPVFINAVQHIVHPPMHLPAWPTDDRRSRIVFITRGMDHVLMRRSLEAFCRTPVGELVVA